MLTPRQQQPPPQRPPRTKINGAAEVSRHSDSQRMNKILLCTIALTVVSGSIGTANAEGEPGNALSFNTFGRPGLIDMPIGATAPDGTLAFSYTYSEGFTRNALFFQFAPLMAATLRYGGNGSANDAGIRPNYDRSLDFVLTPFKETSKRPALSIGLQDALGTGAYAGEFVAATKTSVNGRLSATLGLGWGRLASRGGFSNPLAELAPQLGTRPARDVGRGGRPAPDQWFRGDAAVFGGVAYQATDKLTLTAEYSADDYTQFTSTGILTAKSPFNLGLSFQVFDGIYANAAYLQGTKFALGFSIQTNLKQSPYAGSREKLPAYVVPSNRGPASPEIAEIEDTLEQMFDPSGLTLLNAEVEGNVLRVAFVNRVYDMEAQAFGRAVRWMTHVAAPNIERFELVSVVSGMPTTQMTLSRADIEAAEHATFGTEMLRDRSVISTAPAHHPGYLADFEAAPEIAWGIGPYAKVTLFDPDEPRRVDVGVEGSVRVRLGEGLMAATTLQKRLAGNRNEARTSNSVLPKVRSNQSLYDQTDNVRIENLYVSAFHRLATDVYSRATLGYFEQMYAGLSGEILWKPFDRNWSLGAELNHVVQRDFDGKFGLRDYNVSTGHVSVGHHLDSGYYGKVEAGRYLAGDLGATFIVGRSFANGWDLSAYATLTDVPFDDFGEGSFDKGIRLEIPMAALLGTARRHKYRFAINSINRDGGQRVSVPGRLSEVLEGYSGRELSQTWSRILR